MTNQQTNLDGFEKTCRDCGRSFYLHRSGSGGRWRAYDATGGDADMGEWTRHRCASALRDADEMAAILPSGLGDPTAIQRLERLVEDLQSLVGQLKTRAAAKELATRELKETKELAAREAARTSATP